ncbi:uncharacterized protein [Notamacropus eugenii]|uniref:uncharacterized protein isoform X2 n=1 Tax=Notamacropus eugenii TaxID=9315 RepID=UPI003B66EF67
MSTCSQLSKKKANETVKKSVRFMEPEVIREKHQMTFEAEEKKKEKTGPQEEISTRGCSFTGSRIYPRGPPGSHQQAKLHGQGGPYSQGGSQGQAGPSDQASPHDQAGPYDQTDSYSAQPPAKRPRGKKGMKKDEERGRMNLNEDDLCDCLERACLGCFYLCPQCQSTKCGPTCRSNQNWIYKANTNEGGEVVSTFPFSHAKY